MEDLLVSIIVYVLTAVLLYILAQSMVREDRTSMRDRGVHSKMWSISFILSILFFAIIAGARYNTGVDHLNYLDFYNHGGDETDEVGFFFISHFLSGMGVHYFFYFALWASLQITFVYLSFKHRRELLPFVGLLIMLGPYFLDWMNGIRQTLVECFFLYIVSCHYSKRAIKSFIISLLLVLLATTIHRSSIILAALLFLALLNIPLKNRVINVSAVIVCVLLGATPYWITMNSSGMADLLAFLGYDHYSLAYEGMVEMADFKETAFGPLRLMTLAVDLIIIWFYPKIKDYYAEDNILGTFFLFFLLGVCSYNLFANTNILFLRPIAYLTFFRLPMTAYALCYLKKTKNLWFYITCVLTFTYSIVEVLKSGLLGIKETNLYHFFFLQ